MANLPIFRPSFGNRPDRIIGRESVMQLFADGLVDYPGSRSRATFLIGQRGMGKTALLLEMADTAREHDFIAVRITCGNAMLENTLDSLQRTGAKFVDDKKIPIKGFNAGALGFSFGLTFTEEARVSYGFRTKLEMICERLDEAGKGVAILVDEVTPSSPEMRQLATTYQELVGEGANIAIAMAGLPASVSRVLNEETLTFLNRATKIELEPIPITIVQSYFESVFARLDRPIDENLLNEAARATEGFPYLLQLVGYYLEESTDAGKTIVASDVERAKRLAFADLNENVFRAMLTPLSHADIAFLKAMAQDDGPTKVGDLEGRLNVSQGHVQSYRKRLIEAGVIASPRRGELSFIVPRLANYLRELEQ